MGANTTGGAADNSWLVVDEETAAELSKLLESGPLPTKVRFTDDPYSSLVAVQCSSGYVTIDVNDESCGSSFSDPESSVMASFDVGGWRRCRGAWGFHDGEDAMWVEEFLEQVFG